ncbi:MAG: ribosomal protein S18-alanine N-acetyltransferase [Chloroflexi bacterium]|nr:ribosomal protein S18-alanine N-acetyltransferase [Chloroflexota bacterium]
MRQEDVVQVSVIEREAFPTQWPATSFERELRNKMAHYLVTYEEDDTEESSADRGGGAEGEPNQSQAQSGEDKLLSRVLTGVRRLLSSEQTAAQAVGTQKIVGFVGFWLMAGEAHITAIATKEEYRRRGIGEMLLMSCVELATQLNADAVTLEVRVSNSGAQALYEKYGFTRTGRRTGYYTDNHEDAFIMTTDRISSASYQTTLAILKRNYQKRWGIAGEP